MGRTIGLTVNGRRVEEDVEPRLLLVQFLRDRLGLTGTHVGCDTSNCGACTVHLDGEAVKSCTVLAVQADGCEVTTIEGLAQDGELHPMQRAFHEEHALQCGYCTPGHDHERGLPARAEPRPERGGDAPRPRGQPLPLHRVPEHRPCACSPRPRRSAMATDDELGASAQSVLRKEDAPLITGQGRYVDDIKLPGMAFAAFVRSPHAHARISSIDSSAARGHARRRQGADLRRPRPRGRRAVRLEPVRRRRAAEAADPGRRQGAHVGEPVAIVVAETHAARDAADRVVVDYDPLPVVIDAENAGSRARRRSTRRPRATTAARSSTRPRASTRRSTPRPSRSR